MFAGNFGTGPPRRVLGGIFEKNWHVGKALYWSKEQKQVWNPAYLAAACRSFSSFFML